MPKRSKQIDPRIILVTLVLFAVVIVYFYSSPTGKFIEIPNPQNPVPQVAASVDIKPVFFKPYLRVSDYGEYPTLVIAVRFTSDVVIPSVFFSEGRVKYRVIDKTDGKTFDGTINPSDTELNIDLGLPFGGGINAGASSVNNIVEIIELPFYPYLGVESPYPSPGWHELELIVDPENKILETNEDNNKLTVQVGFKGA